MIGKKLGIIWWVRDVTGSEISDQASMIEIRGMAKRTLFEAFAKQLT